MRLVDADALKALFLRPYSNEETHSNIDICSRINSSPTVDAIPLQHGHWIRNNNGTYSCSECKSWIPNEQHYYARYCLFCGAKMDEQET